LVFKWSADLDFSSSRLCSWSRQAFYSTKIIILAIIH
jgi:hypothetical protein